MTETHERPEVPPIVLCIPGAWESPDELMHMLHSREKYTLEGTTLTDRVSGRAFKMDLRPADPRIPEAFVAGARRPLDYRDRRALQAHRLVAYVLGRGGTTAAAYQIMEAAEELIKAGGIGVKVETSGVAHTANNWLAVVDLVRDNVDGLYEAFVTILGGNGHFQSVGMHNLGFRDAEVAGKMAPREAAALISLFNLHCLRTRRALVDGQVFGAGDEQNAWRIVETPCTTFPPGDLFHNPFGLWRLEPVLEESGEAPEIRRG